MLNGNRARANQITAPRSTFSDVIKRVILDSRSSSPDYSITTVAPAGFEAEGGGFQDASQLQVGNTKAKAQTSLGSKCFQKKTNVT